MKFVVTRLRRLARETTPGAHRVRWRTLVLRWRRRARAWRPAPVINRAMTVGGSTWAPRIHMHFGSTVHAAGRGASRGSVGAAKYEKMHVIERHHFAAHG